MAFRSSILVLLVAMALLGASSGADAAAVYKVGGSDSWVVQTDYNQWSNSKQFHVGDSLFFSYATPYHNVIEVTEQGFKSCNSSSPMAVHSSGSDTIKLERPGRYYFLCGAPGHCAAGQKVQVMVSLPTPDSPVSVPSPAPSGLSSPSNPHPEARPPRSAALTIDAPKLASAFSSLLVFFSIDVLNFGLAWPV